MDRSQCAFRLLQPWGRAQEQAPDHRSRSSGDVYREEVTDGRSQTGVAGRGKIKDTNQIQMGKSIRERKTIEAYIEHLSHGCMWSCAALSFGAGLWFQYRNVCSDYRYDSKILIAEISTRTGTGI